MSVHTRHLQVAPLTPEEATRQQLMRDVLVGFARTPKALAPRYHFDATGSALFDAICDAEDYTLTRCEFEILRRDGPALARRFAGGPLDLVDLGAGDGRKTAVLVDALLDRGVALRYVPLDFSAAALHTAVEAMAARFPALDIEGLIGDYFEGVRWLSEQGQRPKLVLFLGSNIGNFDAPGAAELLHRLARALRPGDRLLIGFDLRKEPEPLRLAYNDREGAAERFNLNLLDRLNRELGGDFDRARFCHCATYDPVRGAIDFYLISREAQRVTFAALGRSYDFGPWEALHVGSSQKYLLDELGDMALSAGFVEEARHLDGRGWFCDALWRVPAR